jgi:hypothetical protein
MAESVETARDTGDDGIRGILTTLGPRTRTLALVLFVVDSIFGLSIFSAAAIAHLSSEAFTVAVICLSLILLASIAAITRVELTVERGERNDNALKPSSGTPSSEVLDALVNNTLEAICRTTSLPLAPDVAGMRAFIFKGEKNELVCRYYWALNPTSEKVGVTRFQITEDVAHGVAVVNCVRNRAITRAEVGPLPDGLNQVAARTIKRDLTFVPAAPILDQTGKVWGSVDFDSSNDLGKERLSTPSADAAIYQLTKHLQVILWMRAATIENASPPLV